MGTIPLATARKLVSTPGVTGSAALLPTRVIAVNGGKPEDYPAQGLLAGGQSAIDLDVRSGEYAADGIGASETMARHYGWQVGDVVPLWLSDGSPVNLRLTMVYARARGFGEVVLPAGLVAAHDPKGLVNAVGLRYGPGTEARSARSARPRTARSGGSSTRGRTRRWPAERRRSA
jgi:putative ABC transport system permease protein